MSIPVNWKYDENIDRSLFLESKISVIIAVVLSKLPPMYIEKVLGYITKGSEKADECDVYKWINTIEHYSLICRGNGCLVRSLSVMVLGALNGSTPVWCTGVKTTPFSSHAWVEVDNKPIGELMPLDSYMKLMVVQPKWSNSND